MRRIEIRPLLIVLAWVVPLGFLILFYFFPLTRILALSLTPDNSEGFAGIRTLLERVDTAQVLRIARFTFWQALLSTIVTLAVGLPGAYLLARVDFPGKRVFRAITGIPFVMPTLVVAAGFSAALGPTGGINLWLMDLFHLTNPPIQFMNTLWAIVLAHVFYNTTLVLRIVGGFWENLDPRLGQAALVLGARRSQVWFKVTAPLLMPAILTASLLVFIFDFSSFAVVLVLGGLKFTTLEVEIFYQTSALFNLPQAAVLAIIQLMINIGLMLAYVRSSSSISRPLKLRERFSSVRPLRGFPQRLAAGIVLFSLIGLSAHPLLSLGLRSITSRGSGPGSEAAAASGLTLRYYRELVETPTGSVVNASPATAVAVSLGYAAFTVVLALILGLPAAWLLARTDPSRIRRTFEVLLLLPLGTSAVTLGFGYLVSFSAPPLRLITSPFLIPLAHTLVAFPFVVRSLTPPLQRIQRQVRDAAAVLGASPLQIIRYIDLPLAARALLVAGMFAFLISMGEFGATALVSRPEFPTIPVVIYRFLSRPGALNYGQAMALSTILMLVTAGGMLVIERFRVGDARGF